MLRILKRFRNETDESRPLLRDAEATNEQILRYSGNKAFFLSEFEISFELINETLPNLSNYESLRVIECPKFESALESIPNLLRGFLSRFNLALCLHFAVDDDIGELTAFEFFNFFNTLKELSKSFLIIFEDEQYDSSMIFWRPKDAFQIFSLQVEENSVSFTDFLKKFLMTCLKIGHNGIHPLMQNYSRNQIRVKSLPALLADEKGVNLLHLAARDGKLEIVKFLLNICDLNLAADGKIAIDYAYENDHFNIVNLLLNENSRYPRDFEVTPSMPEKLKSFVDISIKLHEAIELKCLETVKKIVNENSNLRFFYDIKNRSAMNVALTSEAFEIYKFLMTKNFTLGPHEIFKDLLQKLTRDQRDELAEINESMLQNVAEKHILALMSSTQVGPDDKEARLNSVYNALQRLNTIPGIKILLQIVAASRNFQLIFDFKRDHILFLQPAEEGYVTGLFDVCGRIYIGAQHLLNPSKAHEVLGVIAHELCHYVMWIVFKNHAKPYEVKDEVKRVRFEEILEQCKLNSHLEGIVDLAFSQYEENMHVAELIVRVPHALGLYIDDEEKLEDFKENFTELSNFYNEVVSTMQAKLPEIEEEAENKIRAENSSPLKFLKYHWKKILLLFLLLALSAFFITFLARSCIFKKCSDSRAFCVFEHFTATCKCHDNLHWNARKCHQCLIDDHCTGSDLCFQNICFDIRSIFVCDNNKRMFSIVRCNGVEECADGTDEVYHCVFGPLDEKTCHYNVQQLTNSDDYLLFINETSVKCQDYEMEISVAGSLPVNISKILPNLKGIYVKKGGLPKISFDNFWGLYELENLNLSKKALASVDGAFKDLLSLKHLYLNWNNLMNLRNTEFANLVNLEVMDLGNNFIYSLSKGIFDSLMKLKVLLLNDNTLLYLSDNPFKNLRCLETLNLNHNRIEDLEPTVFKNLTNLSNLNLGRNFIKILPATIFQTNTKMESLSLSTLKLEIIHETLFDNCPLIKYLELSYNNLSGLSVGTFKNLRMMKVLVLTFNPIEKLDEKVFENTTSLSTIDLSHNKITVIPDNLLRSLKFLQFFIANNNSITSLKTIFFHHNQKVEKLIFNKNSIESIEEDLIDDLHYIYLLDLSYNLCTGSIYYFNFEYVRRLFKQDIYLSPFCKKNLYSSPFLFRGSRNVKRELNKTITL